MDASEKIIAVLQATPNLAWLAYDTDNVDPNTVQVHHYEDGFNLAWAIIKDIVARGGTTNERWIFGIYNDLEAHYEAAPTDVEYVQRLSDPKVRIETTSGGEVYPWNVKPGKWLEFPDFLIGKTQPAELREDARMLFIEGITYRAPYTLEIRGGDVDRLSQLLGQLGLTGIGG
jgi:hypothetical protein